MNLQSVSASPIPFKLHRDLTSDEPSLCIADVPIADKVYSVLVVRTFMSKQWSWCILDDETVIEAALARGERPIEEIAEGECRTKREAVASLYAALQSRV